MNAIYPTFKSRLMSLFVGAGMPGSASLWVLGVDDSYIYSEGHSRTSDIGGESIVIPETELTGASIAGTLISADDIDINELEGGRDCVAVIVFFKWADETQLLCYLDSTEDGSLPQSIVTDKFRIEWSGSGICRI